MEVATQTHPSEAGANRFAAYAWFVTAVTLAVILWGAFVRASKSGDGCGAHWPLCNGEVLPAAAHSKTLVEFAHRATSGIAFLLVVGLAVWAFRAFPRGHAARKGAALSALFIVTESLIGAGLVLLRLVGNNASGARAVYLSVHLVNTFLLVAALALTAWWANGEREAPRLREFVRGRAGLALFGMLAVGVSGAVAALGATLFPGGEAAAPGAHPLFGLRQYNLHPLLAILVGAYLAHFAARAKENGPEASRLSAAVVALLLVQTAAGIVNAWLLAPVWLQILHLLLADLLWLALVLLCASTLTQPEAIGTRLQHSLKLSPSEGETAALSSVRD